MGRWALQARLGVGCGIVLSAWPAASHHAFLISAFSDHPASVLFSKSSSRQRVTCRRSERWGWRLKAPVYVRSRQLLRELCGAYRWNGVLYIYEFLPSRTTESDGGSGPLRVIIDLRCETMDGVFAPILPLRLTACNNWPPNISQSTLLADAVVWLCNTLIVPWCLRRIKLYCYAVLLLLLFCCCCCCCCCCFWGVSCAVYLSHTNGLNRWNDITGSCATWVVACGTSTSGTEPVGTTLQPVLLAQPPVVPMSTDKISVTDVRPLLRCGSGRRVNRTTWTPIQSFWCTRHLRQWTCFQIFGSVRKQVKHVWAVTLQANDVQSLDR